MCCHTTPNGTPLTGGPGAELVARIDDVFRYLEAPVERVTGIDVPVPLLWRTSTFRASPRIEDGIERALAF